LMANRKSLLCNLLIFSFLSILDLVFMMIPFLVRMFVVLKNSSPLRNVFAYLGVCVTRSQGLPICQ
jgi:hypothetical protein